MDLLSELVYISNAADAARHLTQSSVREAVSTARGLCCGEFLGEAAMSGDGALRGCMSTTTATSVSMLEEVAVAQENAAADACERAVAAAVASSGRTHHAPGGGRQEVCWKV